LRARADGSPDLRGHGGVYLKGVAPPHVFGGVMLFMAIQVLAVVLLYHLPQIGLWLPRTLYGQKEQM
jgi:TRAP-type mannitol/chloroaromatic compound transport system permease large subunit